MTVPSPPPITRPLRLKLLLPLLLFASLAGGLGIWLTHRALTLELGAQLTQRADLLAEAIHYAAETVDDPEELQRYVTALGGRREVRAIVAVAGQPSRIIASTRFAWLDQLLDQWPETEMAQALRQASEHQTSTRHWQIQAGYLALISPLLLNNPQIRDGSLDQGAVLVQLDTAALRETLRREGWQLASGLGLWLLGLAALVYLLLDRLILRPAAAITDTLRQRAGGDRTALAPVSGGDEISALAATLNWMFDAQDTAERALVTAHQQSRRLVDERKAAEQRINYLAWHDTLTGLPNPALAHDRAEQIFAHAARDQAKAAVLLIGLDRFKLINESLGRGYGDRMLQAIAQRFQEALRETDTVSRHGGDEFLVLANSLDSAEWAGRLAQKILDVLAAAFHLDGQELRITASVGVSLFPNDGRQFDALLHKASVALHHAKNSGRNGYRFFSELMNVNALERLQLENRLRQALDRQELYLCYQPLIDLAGQHIVGAEALLRWQNAELGAISPAHFIPIAEESGLIVPIGAWVLQEACQQAQAWRLAGLPALSMAVNISAVQFKRNDLVSTVASTLIDSGLEPSALELELTESVLIQDTDNALRTVQQFKAMGVRLAIDDFGTGYSSMSYLRRLAVDKLKIDQSFVRDLTEDPEDAAIVRAIIQLGHSLRLTTLAEGVETAEQAAFLRKEGCRLAQGYYFGRPMSAEDFAHCCKTQ